MQQVTSPSVRPAFSPTPARLAALAAALALVLLAALHALSPEFDPSWRMVSEYALGRYRWVLSILFVAWALSCVLLFVALLPHVRTLGGKIGLGFLLAAALGMGMAAVFDATHNLHGLTALIGMPSLPIAAMLISASLARTPGWAWARGRLLVTAHLTWISLVVMSAAIMIGLALSGGEFGPNVPAGWPNRLLVTAYCVWLITVAWVVGEGRE